MSESYQHPAETVTFHNHSHPYTQKWLLSPTEFYAPRRFSSSFEVNIRYFDLDFSQKLLYRGDTLFHEEILILSGFLLLLEQKIEQN